MSEVFNARRRPITVPDALEQLDGPAVTGTVTLPVHIDWSSRRSYDLSDRADRLRVYELVLREGTLEDQRRYLDADELSRALDELFLPDHVRDAWLDLLAERVVESRDHSSGTVSAPACLPRSRTAPATSRSTSGAAPMRIPSP